MLKKATKTPGYVAYAILIHIVFFGLLVFSFDWTIKPLPPQQKVIQAVVVDETKLKKRAAELEKEEERKREAQRQKEKKQKEAEQLLLKQKELEVQKKHEQEKRAADLKQKKAEEQRQLRIKQENLKKEQQKEAAEAALKKKAEEARVEKLKIEKEEAERKRKEEVEKRRKEEYRILQEQMAEEEALLTAVRERKVQSVMAEYVEIIKQKVTRNWLQPSGSQEGLKCKVFVRLMPGGEVMDVRIVDGSGDPLFDRSVETAVLKASPLPLPSDPVLAERFRELQFIFNPGE